MGRPQKLKIDHKKFWTTGFPLICPNYCVSWRTLSKKHKFTLPVFWVQVAQKLEHLQRFGPPLIGHVIMGDAQYYYTGIAHFPLHNNPWPLCRGGWSNSAKPRKVYTCNIFCFNLFPQLFISVVPSTLYLVLWMFYLVLSTFYFVPSTF